MKAIFALPISIIIALMLPHLALGSLEEKSKGHGALPMARQFVEAIEKYNRQKVKDFLSKDKELLNKRDGDDAWTGLHYAVNTQRESMINLLLDANADVNALSYQHDTPLHIAARLKSTEIVKLLVDKKANIDALNKNGDAPLHIAAEYGNQAIIAALLLCGASAHTKNKAGKTTLDILREQKGRETRKSASSRKKTKKQSTRKSTIRQTKQPPLPVPVKEFMENLRSTTPLPWGELLRKNPSLLVSYIDKDYANFSLLHHAMKPTIVNGIELVKELINYKANIHAQSTYGSKPFHIAARNGHLEAVKFLCEDMAVNVNDQNYDGNTPLHLAVIGKRKAVAEYLLRKKADVTLKNKNGETAPGLVQRRSNTDKTDITLSKKDRKASAALVKVFKEKGYLPIHVAAKKGDKKLLESFSNMAQIKTFVLQREHIKVGRFFILLQSAAK